MKKISLILFLIDTFFFIQGQPPTTKSEEAKKEIKHLTSVWNSAIEKRDSIALNEVLAPEYMVYSYYTDNPDSAVFISREPWLYNTLHHFTTDSSEVLGEQKVTLYGVAAKSEQTMIWKARYDNAPRFSLRFAVTDIWLKRNGKWQVVMRMSYIVK